MTTCTGDQTLLVRSAYDLWVKETSKQTKTGRLRGYRKTSRSAGFKTIRCRRLVNAVEKSGRVVPGESVNAWS